jgi:tetratricopeptide (TPR) repeat protein
VAIRAEIVVPNGATERIVAVESSRVTIGRDENAGICLPEPMVSRLHAEIIRLGDDFLLRDHGSTNGSFVNDVRVAERLLADGDLLRFGKAGPSILFRLHEPTAPLTTPEAPPVTTTASLVAALEARIAAHASSPTDEATLRCQLAENYLRNGRTTQALTALASYADDAGRDPLPADARSHVELWLGIAYAEAKRYDMAIETLQSSLVLARVTNDEPALAAAHAALGRAYIGADDLLTARDHLHRASLIARKSGISPTRAEAHLLLGKIDWKESDFDGARYNWQRAGRFAEDAEDESLVARCRLQAAFVDYAEGDLASAIPAYQSAIELIKDVGDHRLLLKAYSMLSRALTRNGSWLATERLLEQRLELARETDSAKAEAVALTDLAELRLLQGKRRAASKVIQMALNRHGIVVYARTQRILGRILLAEGRVDESVEAIERGLEVARAKGALEEQILLRLELAQSRLARRDLEGASEAVDAAEATAPLDPALNLLARERYTRGLVFEARGQLAEANRAMTQATSIFTTTGDPYRLAQCHLALGRLRAAMGRPESGRAHLDMARSAFATLGAGADLDQVERANTSPEFAGIAPAMTRPLSLAMQTGLKTLEHSTQLSTRTVSPEETGAPVAPYRILLAVSDASLADLLGRGLAVENFIVDRVEHGRAAIEAATVEPRIHDMLVLDALLEHQSGFDVCRALRGRKIETPVVILGSRPGIADKIEALQVGADDYLFQGGLVFEELLAKMEALLR